MGLLKLMVLTCFTTMSISSTALAGTSVNQESAVASYIHRKYSNTLSEVKSKLIVDKVFRISREYSLDPMLVLAIISVESDFNDQAKSNHGAVGLMQVIPKFHREKLVGKNPMNPLVSIEVGSKILKDCMTKKDISKALRCYNGSDTNHYTKLVLKAQFELNRNFIRKV